MNESRDLLREGPVHILVNPLAGGRRSERWTPQINSVFANEGIKAQFHVTHSAEETELRASEAIRNHAKVLLGMGGDGTLQTLINTPGADQVVLGVLPTGGGNDFAAALGLPQNALSAARCILKGSIRCVDLARATMADGRKRLYCGGGGLGLDAEAARHASETYTGLRGRPRYVLSALQALRRFAAITVQAEFPGSNCTRVEKKVLVAAALNTPSYGGGLRLAEDARIDDGLLDVVFVEDLGACELASVVFHWALRGKLRTQRVARWAAAWVRLTPDRPCQFHGDGEILGPSPVEIAVVPRAIRVLAT